jgi:hypothetical protein
MLHVELPDDNYALVHVGDEEGSRGELNQLEVNRDPD